jgi:Tfp pilus assembly protein PilX
MNKMRIIKDDTPKNILGGNPSISLRRTKMNNTRINNIKKQQENQGFILVTSVIVTLVMLLLAGPFLFQLSADNKSHKKSSKSLTALSLAEAGVERAIWEINYGDMSSWEGDSSERTLTIPDFQTSNGNVLGDIEINVTYPEGDNPVIESIGKVSLTDSQALVARSTMVVLEEVPLFNYAVFGGDGCVDLSSNSMIDSYDSTIGDYGGLNIGLSGHLGTNATGYGCIDLGSNSIIYGNAVSGPDSNPDTDIIIRGNAEIYGEKKSLAKLKDMPSVPAPEGLSIRGDYYLDGDSSDTISVSGEYDSFRITSNAKVTIAADVTLYITGDFSMMSNSQLEIADGASVTIYLGGSFVQESNTRIINLSEGPTKLIIFGTDSFAGEMEWNSNSDFSGAVYVPHAHVTFRSNTDFYGSIICKSFDLHSNARIHFDVALESLIIDIDSEDTLYRVKSWQEKLIH